jgi:hypothetical protein
VTDSHSSNPRAHDSPVATVEGKLVPQRFEIVIDSIAPAALARFWASALVGYEVRPYDDAEIERLAALGLTPETDPTVPIDGPGPTIWFQLTDVPPRTRNRIHLDIRGRDRRFEVERLIALGASIRDEHPDHTVMLDPEGNQFCVIE